MQGHYTAAKRRTIVLLDRESCNDYTNVTNRPWGLFTDSLSWGGKHRHDLKRKVCGIRKFGMKQQMGSSEGDKGHQASLQLSASLPGFSFIFWNGRAELLLLFQSPPHLLFPWVLRQEAHKEKHRHILWSTKTTQTESQDGDRKWLPSPTWGYWWQLRKSVFIKGKDDCSLIMLQ